MRYLWLLLCLCTFASAKPEAWWTFTAKDLKAPYLTGYKYVPRETLRGDFVEQNKDVVIPDTIDLRSKITTIQNQGSCGSCWAFSTTQTMADALMLYGTYPGQPSQQYMVDCDTQNSGCGGGDFNSLDTVVSPKGAPLAKDYPYTARDGRCRTLPAAASIVDWHYVGSSNKQPTTADIQRALVQFGPISVDVSAGGSFMNYSSGIYNACGQYGIDHMTNIVGWNNEGAVANANGEYPAGKGYWIMRNSWGTGWGEQGWMRIRYNDSRGNKCNQLGTTAAYVTVVNIPKVPVTFPMESSQVSLSVTVQPTAHYTVDEAKAIIQSALDSLDRR